MPTVPDWSGVTVQAAKQQAEANGWNFQIERPGQSHTDPTAAEMSTTIRRNCSHSPAGSPKNAGDLVGVVIPHMRGPAQHQVDDV